MKKIGIIILGLAVIILIGGVFFVFTKPRQINILSELPKVNIAKSGANWEEIKPEGTYWEGRDSAAIDVFNGKAYVISGVIGGKVTPPPVYEVIKHGADVWSSSDLIHWDLITDKAPWGHRRTLTPIVFDNKLWVMGGWNADDGGTKNDIWSTKDGVDWKLETSSADWSEREGFTLNEFKGKLWITGGVNFFTHKTYSEVWSSEDGIHWKLETTAPWEKRYDHTVTVWNDKLWMIGGMDFGNKVFKDIWTSEDGVNWKQEKTPNMPARHGNASFAFDNKLWLIAGWCEDEDRGLNDTWYTEDGVNWKQLKIKTPWPGREDVSGIIWNNEMVIMGGMADLGKQWEWRNDIWQLNL